MSTMNRWTVASEILTFVREHEDMVGVKVTALWPGEDLADETVWLDELAGELSNPLMGSGRKYRDDNFTVPLNVRIVGKATEEACMTRLAEVLGAIESVVADHTEIAALSGVVTVSAPTVEMFGAETRDGFIGRGVVTIPVLSRLT